MKFIILLPLVLFLLSWGKSSSNLDTPAVVDLGGKASTTTTVTPTVTPTPGSSGPRACYLMDTVSCDAFYATNAARTKNGLVPLSFCTRCYSMALDQSMDMQQRNYFSHDRPAFSDRAAETFSARAKRFGFTCLVGENIAKGFTTGQPLVDAWMGSTGHRANILNTSYKSFAVVLYKGYATQVFSGKLE